MTEDELLDEVDDADTVIGTIWRSETMRRGSFRNFRVINAFIRNEKGELWVPRRGPHKRIFPNALDVSVGGHVGAGEAYELAFERETAEEVGIRLADVVWRVVAKLTPPQHDVSAFMTVYEIRSDATPDYNRDDFTESWWLTPTQLRTRLAAGEAAKEYLIKILNQVYPA